MTEFGRGVWEATTAPLDTGFAPPLAGAARAWYASASYPLSVGWPALSKTLRPSVVSVYPTTRQPARAKAKLPPSRK